MSRDDVVRYLEKYAEVHELEIVTGVEVDRVERGLGGDGESAGAGPDHVDGAGGGGGVGHER